MSTSHDPLIIRSRILEYGSRPTPEEFKQGAKGAIRGAINKAIKMTSEIKEGRELSIDRINKGRRLVMSWMVCPESEPFKIYSSKDPIFTPQIWNGFSRWHSKFVDGEYIERETFKDEVWWTLFRARVDWRVTIQMKENFSECLRDWRNKPEIKTFDVTKQAQTEFVMDQPQEQVEYDDDPMVGMY